MPTYVYKFVDTGETIEVQQSFEDDSLTEAVHPGSGATMKVKKVFLPVGVSFKGGGFYKTDSRGGSSKSSANGSSSSESSSPSPGSSTSTSTSTSTSSDTSATKSTPAASSTTTSAAAGAD